MPSPAAQTFAGGVLRARTLYKAAADARLRPIAQFDAQSFYHSGLTAIVAAWDSYLNGVVLDFYSATGNPTCDG